MNLLTELFSLLLERSAEVLPVLAVVLLVRLVLSRQGSRRVLYALWTVVGLRLVLPGSFPTAISVFNLPSVQHMQATAATVAPTLGQMNRTVSVTPPPIPSPPVGVAGMNGMNGMELLPTMVDPSRPSLLEVLALVWFLGLVAMVLVSLWNYAELRRRLRTAVLLEGNVFQCDAIETPFVLGMFRPRIYLPFRMEAEERGYVLLHERTHIARGDQLVKPLAFLILAAYWFHPGVWLAWLGLCRDMELCCDEAVLRTLGSDVKAAYSRSLLDFATARRFPAPSPLAFGEHDASVRIRNVLRWKQAASAAVFLAVCLCVLTVLICGTDGQRQSTLRNRGEKTTDGQELVTLSYTLAGNVREAAVYEEVYYRGALQSSRPVLDGLFHYGEDPEAALNHLGELRIGASIDREENSLSWVMPQDGALRQDPVNLGKTATFASVVCGALGENQRTKKPLENGSILLYVALGTQEGRQDLSFVQTDASGDWPEVWQQGYLDAADFMVLLRVKLTPAVGTVKITDGGLFFSLDQEVQTLAYYADVYQKGQLIDSQLLTYQIRGQGLRGKFLESWNVDWGQDQTQVTFQRTANEKVMKEKPVDIPSGYDQRGWVFLGAGRPKQRTWDLKLGESLYLIGVPCATAENTGYSCKTLHPDLKNQLIYDNDVVVLLRVVPEAAAQVRAESLSGTGKSAAGRFSFTCPPQAQSFVLYQEVYENGQVQSNPMVMDDFDSGFTDRQFALDITADVNLKAGQVGWNILTGGATMSFPNHGSTIGALPVSTVSSSVWDTDGEAQPMRLEENFILMAFGLSNQNEASPFSCQSLMDNPGLGELTATNDRVVLLRLQISTRDLIHTTAALPGMTRPATAQGETDQASAQALWAQTLWEQQITELELTSGVDTLWSVVRPRIEGMRQNTSYSMALLTPETGDVLLLDFAAPPTDATALDRSMWEKGCLLLALVGNLREIRWTYPRMENGEETLVTNDLPLDNAETNLRLGQGGDGPLAAYQSLKDCAASPADVQNLLRALETN